MQDVMLRPLLLRVHVSHEFHTNTSTIDHETHWGQRPRHMQLPQCILTSGEHFFKLYPLLPRNASEALSPTLDRAACKGVQLRFLTCKKFVTQTGQHFPGLHGPRQVPGFPGLQVPGLHGHSKQLESGQPWEFPRAALSDRTACRESRNCNQTRSMTACDCGSSRSESRVWYTCPPSDNEGLQGKAMQ